ncbi:MAG TPA: NAD(P)H-hydrate dehydratase [Longimicrobiaceae bacterium]|nr:NAD(P)H-hydrate dehydratase [Longimicrobiaceae bacterium]
MSDARGKKSAPRPKPVTAASLRRMSLPRPDEGGDKESRGRVMVVGGAVSVPGAIVLAGIAALRVGAGKLQLATSRSVAPLVGVTVPECLALGLPETKAGGIAPRAAAAILERAARAEALLIGPGMMDPDAVRKLVSAVLAEVDRPALVLDAGALAGLANERGALKRLRGRVVVTPHAGEMAGMLGIGKDEVDADPAGTACRAAADLGIVVALKGSETHVATPDGALYRYAGGSVGLATSGSGDTLAGLVAGLAARGAEPAVAACWGVFLHGEAGNVLGRTRPLGFLARELLDEVPAIMAGLAK